MDAIKKWRSAKYYRIIILSSERKDRIYPPSRYIFNELLAAGIASKDIEVCHDSFDPPVHVRKWDLVDGLSFEEQEEEIQAEKIGMEELELESAMKSIEG